MHSMCTLEVAAVVDTAAGTDRAEAEEAAASDRPRLMRAGEKSLLLSPSRCMI